MIGKVLKWIGSRFSPGREFFLAADVLRAQAENAVYVMEFTGTGRKIVNRAPDGTIVDVEYHLDPGTALALSGKFKYLGLDVKTVVNPETEEALIYPVCGGLIMSSAIRSAFSLSLADQAWLFDPAMYTDRPMTVAEIAARLEQYGNRL